MISHKRIDGLELLSLGYRLCESGYGVEDRNLADKKYLSKGYNVVSFYVKTDTRGLKMWELWAKKTIL